MHLLSALDQRTGCVLAQALVPSESIEPKTALTLLKSMVPQDRVNPRSDRDQKCVNPSRSNVPLGWRLPASVDFEA